MFSAYRFPPNASALAAGRLEQLDKMHEELYEVVRAHIEAEGPARMIEETWDLIQAAEGFLRKFDPAEVEAGRLFVLDKCAARGDYPVGIAERWPGANWDAALERVGGELGLVGLMADSCDNCAALEICDEHSGTCAATRARWLLEAMV